MEDQATLTGAMDVLEARGVTRRGFMKLCAGVAAAAGLSQVAIPRVAEAIEKSVIGATSGDLYPAIWIEGASCTGCTESFAQIETPDVASVVLDIISLNYSETLSAAAGHSVEEAKEQTIAAGNYILIYEGAVLEGWGGHALRASTVSGETSITGCEALIEAAENGKDVVVMVELRARFDEEHNIKISRQLEDAGCKVIYGLNKYKVHSKLCLITKKTSEGHSYITQIGTGNYNEKTSKLYTDLSIITANQQIGSEAAMVFNHLLCGETVENTTQLMVAPHCLQNKVVDLIENEIDKARNDIPAYIGIKINSLTDKVIIDKLVEASKAGVKIEMIVRGICCLIPEIPGETENITVISVVGRYLEHSRIYRFGVGDEAKVYISSADFMTRNTIRRVEVATPVLDKSIKNEICRIFDVIMKDDAKGRIQHNDGIYYSRELNNPRLDSQMEFYAEAYGKEKMKV